MLLLIADIDECIDSTGICHTYATCANTEGSFTCTCNDGYNGDGTDCAGNIAKGETALQ